MTFTIEKKHVIAAVLTLAILGAVGSSVYFFVNLRKSQALLKNPAEAAKTDNKKMIDAVAAVVNVPYGEEPTVAVVTDLEKLAGQPFFAQAQKDDRVIFYANSKRAILYRPGTGKIIEMSAVSVGTEDVAGAQAPAPTGILSAYLSPKPTPLPEPKAFNLAIFNGTTTPKLANTMQSLLTEKLPLATVVKKDNAVNTEYARTVVVDLKGTKSAETKALSTLIGGEMTILPAGEISPDGADVLVIIGANWKP